METPVSVLERHFDIDLSAESAREISALPFDRWHEFALEYKRYADSFAALNEGQYKDKEEELAPYLFEYIDYGEGLGAPYEQIGETQIGQILNALKRLLLYHHRVFIPDWFLWLLDYARFPSDLKEQRDFNLNRIVRYLEVLVAAKPLFDKGIINMIPTEALIESPVAFEPSKYELIPKIASTLDIPSDDVSQQLDTLLSYQKNALGLGVDMIFPDSLSERIFISGVKAAVRERLPISLIEKLPMPGLERLRLGDLVALRQSDETFGAWRDQLLQIYADAKREESTIGEHPEEFAREMAARLRQEKDKIQKGVESQGYWQNVKQSVW